MRRDKQSVSPLRRADANRLIPILANCPLMNLLQETVISCPYCGETITLLVDGSVAEQQYIEDCEVCCRPIHIRVNIREDGEHEVEAQTEND